MMWKRTWTGLCSAALVATSPVCALAATAPTEIPTTSARVELHVHPGYELRVPAVPSHASDDGLATHARSAVVMDYATGKLLYQKDSYEKLPMASITKIMTMLLIMEAIDDGRIKLSDRIKASEYAASMGGSQIFLEPGETMTLEEMMKGIAIASANDACVAVAEHLAGSEEKFVAEMNERAKELGMDHTHFVNCNGLPAPNHYSCAYDIGLMSRELLKHKEITRFTSVYSDYLRKDTEHPLWLVNTNKLVRFYDGVDGLKTGYTAEAKYCLSATASKGSFRVITVVMGEPKATFRNAEVSKLLNWSFANFASQVLYQQGQKVTEIQVSHGIPERLPVCAGDTVGFIHQKGKELDVNKKVNLFEVTAPVKKGQRVGTLQVIEDDDVVAETPLVAGASVRRAGLFESIGRTIRDIVTFGAAKG